MIARIDDGRGSFRNWMQYLVYVVLFYGCLLPILFSISNSIQLFTLKKSLHSLYLLDSWFLSFDQSEKL